MKQGDIITGEQANRLPDESVVRGADGANDHGCVAIRRGGEWLFVNRGERSQGQKVSKLYFYELLYLPPKPALKVGDVVRTAEQAAALPVGSVVVDMKDDVPHRAPAVKVGENRWLWQAGDLSPYYGSDDDVCVDEPDDVDVLVYLPDADTRAGSAAA